LDRADHLVTVSQALADRAIEYGFCGGRVTVLRNGVDAQVFRPVDGASWRKLTAGADACLLMVGNLVPLKGHNIVIRALEKLPGAHLLIAGEGPESRSLRSLASQLGLGNRVHFLGAVPHHELASVYSAADLLVLASESEGWPNVLLEAMSCGTPSIATRVGGTPEILTTPQTGIVFDNRSVDGVAEAVRRALNERAPREVVRAHAQAFDWDRVISRQVDLYQGIVEAAQSRRRQGTQV
jgi:glycosyltransferase involved in cell wall biosynthesis